MFGRRRQGSLAVLALLTTVVLAGCGDAASSPRVDDQPSVSEVDEMTAHDGEVCPKQLPASGTADHGFGTSEPAESAPSLAPPESAWVCQYWSVDDGPGPDGDGTTYAWERQGRAQPVAADGLAEIEAALGQLAPMESEACTSDLGPRWMLVHAIDKDLTGVVVDDFGCRDVRLTDDPFETSPGEATQPGTVSGVLSDPAGLLGLLKAAHDD